MQPVEITGLIALFVAYFLFTFINLRKKRGIKSRTGSIFFKDRNLYGISLELAIFAGFVFAVIRIYTATDGIGLSLFSRIGPFAALFFLQTLFRGIGEWRAHREEQRYWHEWSASTTILLAFTLIMMMKG